MKSSGTNYLKKKKGREKESIGCNLNYRHFHNRRKSFLSIFISYQPQEKKTGILQLQVKVRH